MINVDQIITANLEECEIGIIPSFELPIEEEKKILLRSNHQLSHAYDELLSLNRIEPLFMSWIRIFFFFFLTHHSGLSWKKIPQPNL